MVILRDPLRSGFPNGSQDATPLNLRRSAQQLRRSTQYLPVICLHVRIHVCLSRPQPDETQDLRLLHITIDMARETPGFLTYLPYEQSQCLLKFPTFGRLSFDGDEKKNHQILLILSPTSQSAV